MEISKERINEIAYALLLVTMSKQNILLDPDRFKRNMGNLPQELQHLPEQFRSISAKELQFASKVICHDLVDYALGFTFKEKKS